MIKQISIAKLIFRDKLDEYIKQLKTEYSKDLVLPTKQMEQISVNPNSKTSINKQEFQNNVSKNLRVEHVCAYVIWNIVVVYFYCTHAYPIKKT